MVDRSAPHTFGPRSVLALLVASLAACDPGGSYSVPGGAMVMANGREFDISGSSNTSLRVHAGWFAGQLHIALAITNNGTTPLTIRPDGFRVADRKGSIKPYPGFPTPNCSARDIDGVATLARGETCRMFAAFQVVVERDRLQTLTLVHDGVARDGIAVPVSMKFEMDDP